MEVSIVISGVVLTPGPLHIGEQMTCSPLDIVRYDISDFRVILRSHPIAPEIIARKRFHISIDFRPGALKNVNGGTEVYIATRGDSPICFHRIRGAGLEPRNPAGNNVCVFHMSEMQNLHMRTQWSQNGFWGSPIWLSGNGTGI